MCSTARGGANAWFTLGRQARRATLSTPSDSRQLYSKSAKEKLENRANFLKKIEHEYHIK